MAVYVLLDKTRTCCKIGFSKSVKHADKRVAGLQTASPFKLDLIVINPYLDRSDELRLHRELSNYTTGGGREWFDYTHEAVISVVKYIESAVVFRDTPNELSTIFEAEDENSDDDDCDLPDDCNVLMQEAYEWAFASSPKEFIDKVNNYESYDHNGRDKLKHYIGLDDPSQCKIVSTGELFAFLLDGCGDEFYERAQVALLVHKLNTHITNDFDDDENYGFISHSIFIHHGCVIIIYEAEFNVAMEQAEEVYGNLFWDVDEFGSQLFVFCVNAAREYKCVPYGIFR